MLRIKSFLQVNVTSLAFSYIYWNIFLYISLINMTKKGWNKAETVLAKNDPEKRKSYWCTLALFCGDYYIHKCMNHQIHDNVYSNILNHMVGNLLQNYHLNNLKYNITTFKTQYLYFQAVCILYKTWCITMHSSLQ